MLLQAIVDDPLMRHSAILVFANKQDMVSHCLPICCAGRPFQTACTLPQLC